MNWQKRGEWLVQLTPPEWENKTIEEVLREELLVPKQLLHQWRMEKGVRLNGEVVPWSTLFTSKNQIELHAYASERPAYPSVYGDLSILFEDDHLLVVNKPAQMDTHPTNANDTDSLANLVAFYLESEGYLTIGRHIHRLDQDTTGAILFGKHPLVSSMLDRMLARREIKRTYVALVEGKMKQAKGKIDAPIGKDRHVSGKRRVSPTGQAALTNFKVIQYIPKLHATLVALELDTGRTHQIRVHMSHIGHPLVGDELYGGRPVKEKRQALHAFKLSFNHPLEDQQIEVYAPLFPNHVFGEASRYIPFPK